MIYNFNDKNYGAFKVFEENKLPPRSYFIPFASASEGATVPLVKRRYSSSLVKCLNGDWDFKYYPRIKDVPKSFDTSHIDFDRIKVPSCWQCLGYEPPFYTNGRYPFPLNPPYVPKNNLAGVYGKDINGLTYVCGEKQYNSTGVYRTFVDIQDTDKHFVISFLGVCSCLDLYVNGQYVGYSEGAHNTAEFDLDKYFFQGKNEIIAVVRKWSTASYLEDQDMFRYCGIFRDVLLYVTPKTCVEDFSFNTQIIKEGLYSAKVDVKVANPQGAFVTVELKDGLTTKVKQTHSASELTSFAFDKLDVVEWNAELTKVYTLVITIIKDNQETEAIYKYVGFRTIGIDGDKFLLNGRLIKMRGVNHHDTNPRTGYYMTPSDIEKDIKLFKSFNINTVRTSHYPPDPMFIELCDVYGVYVALESDIEVNAAYSTQVSNRSKWEPRYWDRVSRMFYRDRNSCSVTLLSLGNESGGIKCHQYCYNKLKELTTIPIFYEGASHFSKVYGFDVVSQMYTSHEDLEKIGNKCYGKGNVHNVTASRPFYMCEYAHAMGTGAGGMEDYWNIIYAHDNLMGGCIWEFADHAVYHENAKYQYTYGGDHGEYLHDGNFCMDGLFTPERKPHTGAYQMKNIYRPVRAKYLGKGAIELINYNNFRSTGYLTIRAYLYRDTKKIADYDLSCNIPAGQSQKINLMLDKYNGEIYLNLDYWDQEQLVATEQLIVSLTKPIVYEKYLGGGKLELYNSDNASLDSNYNIKGTVIASGAVVKELDMSGNIPLQQSVVHNLEVNNYDGKKSLRLEYIKNDKIISSSNINMSEVNKCIIGLNKKGNIISATELGEHLDVSFDMGKVVFDKTSGALLSYTHKTVSYFVEKTRKSDNCKGVVYTNLFRAPTDNDKHFVKDWYKVGLDSLEFVLKNFEYKNHENNTAIDVIATGELVNDKNKAVYKEVNIYTVYPSGVIRIKSDLTPILRNLPILPRIGKTFEFKNIYDSVSYYGLGDMESYPDMKAHTRLGIYDVAVKDFMSNELKPQESGNRSDIRFAIIHNKEGKGLVFVRDAELLNINAKYILDKDLAKCKHREDMVFSEEKTYISVDSYVGGLGSGSCGPDTQAKYTIDGNLSYSTSFYFAPISAIVDNKKIF